MRAAGEAIAAIATPLGAGGIGIVRLSGDNLRGVAKKVLFSKKTPPARVATRAKFVDEKNKIIDDGLVIFFPAPHSFTGQDVLEFHGHGGAVVVRQLYARCLQTGARAATAGEFTLRAYLNGKLDLTQAEGLADLINAQSSAAARAAAASLAGNFSAAVNKIAADIASVRVDIESALDFADEDISPAVLDSRRLQNINNDLQTLIAQAEQGTKLTVHPRIVIAGAVNVGKSSLLNLLANESAAIVADRPGTTRDAVSRDVNIGEIILHLTDTAGFRRTKNDIENEGIARARRAVQNADVVLVVCDDKKKPPPVDTDGKIVTVQNKIDLRGEKSGCRNNTVYLSAKTGDGLAALKKQIRRAVGIVDAVPPFTARARHIAWLKKSAANVQNAVADAAQPELAAAWLSDARQNLQSLTRPFNDEELLGEIFSKFCIGK